MRISDWSSDVCSSDLTPPTPRENWQAEDARIEAAPPTPESQKAVGDVAPTYGEERVEPRLTACARAPAADHRARRTNSSPTASTTPSPARSRPPRPHTVPASPDRPPSRPPAPGAARPP